MKVKIEDELCGVREEKERQEDVSEDYLSAHRQEPGLPSIKDEQSEPPCGNEEELQRPNIKKEEELPSIKEESDFTELPVAVVLVKTEDEDDQYEDENVTELRSHTQQMTKEIDGEHSWLAPMSDGDDIMSHSPHTNDDDEELKGEMTHHTDSKHWKCSQCGKTFGYKSSLKRHMMDHTGEKPFACSVCDQRFSLKTSMIEHTRSHTGEKPFACSVCGKRFSCKRNLTQHTRTHTGEKPFACSVCGKTFSWKTNLAQHTRTHTGEKPFACSICDQRFSHKVSMITHTRIHTSEKPFACLDCDQDEGGGREEKKGAEPLRGSSSQHMRTEINGENCGGSQADSCLTSMLDGDHTMSHSPPTNGDDERSESEITHPTDSKRWKCSQCEKTFGYVFNLRRHMMGHTGEKPFGCLDCGKRFTNKRNMIEHARTHAGEKPFACLDCGKRFTNKRNMIAHTKVHTGEKPETFACSVFSQKFSQREHLKSHTGEKLIVCSLCGQRFSSKLLLTRHKCAVENSSDQ